VLQGSEIAVAMARRAVRIDRFIQFAARNLL